LSTNSPFSHYTATYMMISNTRDNHVPTDLASEQIIHMKLFLSYRFTKEHIEFLDHRSVNPRWFHPVNEIIDIKKT
jgi:hypothetical protein